MPHNAVFTKRAAAGPTQGGGANTQGLLDGRPRDYNIPFVDNTLPASRSSGMVA